MERDEFTSPQRKLVMWHKVIQKISIVVPNLNLFSTFDTAIAYFSLQNASMELVFQLSK